MPRYHRHVFTCVNTRDEADARGCCAARGGEQIAAWFKAEGKARNWKGRVRANKAGCLDACEFGPVVVVYPDQIWYAPRTQEDVSAICDHVDGGEPARALVIPGFD